MHTVVGEAHEGLLHGVLGHLLAPALGRPPVPALEVPAGSRARC